VRELNFPQGWNIRDIDIKSLLKKLLLFTLKIPSVTRINLEFELQRQFKRLQPGRVLDVGSSNSPYKQYLPYTDYKTLDANKHSKPDICCDIHQINWELNYFDTVIATEVLEHLCEPQKAVEEIHKVMKPGGICILSTRFIYAYHPEPQDYYRFSQDSLKYLLKDFSQVEIYPHGNRIQAIWQIINNNVYNRKLGFFLNIFNPLIARINFKDEKFPCGFVVWAQK
jgi:SAM-dependent methyltransferase